MKINESKHFVTQEQLRQWVEYNPNTGQMFRIKFIYPKTGETYSKRKEIMGTNNRGYRWLKVFGDMYLVHRLAVLCMTGRHPKNEVDHINGDRLDNRWKNLRECDAFINSRNQGIRKDCTSGVRGVTYSKIAKKWTARISHMGDRYSLGYFTEFDDAVKARRKAEVDLGYHPNHARRTSW